MNGIAVLELALGTSDMVAMAYLSDLSDAELMMRPHPQCNHVNWQVGHLISAEHEMMKSVAAEKMPPLPDGFAEKYSKEHARSDDPAEFATKEELMAAYRVQREGTLSYLRGLNEDDLDKETGIHYAPTVAALINMQAAHWLMHCGQWVVVRRQAGKPVVI
ncbi:MAG: DinB family protein [Planctomycetota bacterium]|nr:MAG: DinB family protein [Planctomycetota bacterium]